MARLQDLLSQSVTQTLGLNDILSQKEREAQQLGQVSALEGQLEASKIRGRSRRRRGLFETAGTLLGAGAGAAGFAIGGPAGAGLGAKISGGLSAARLGAKAGQTLGGALSGETPSDRASTTSRGLQSILDIGSQFQSAKAALDLSTRETESNIDFKKAQTKKIINEISKSTGTDIGALVKFRDNLLKDKGVENSRSVTSAAGSVRDLLETGNPITAEAVKLQIPRLLGEVGNLNRAEQQAFGGSKSLLDSAKQLFEKWETGKLTDTNKTFLLEIVDTLSNSAAKRGNKRIDSFIKSESTLGVSLESLNDLIDPFRFNLSSNNNEEEFPVKPSGLNISEKDFNNSIEFILNNPNNKDAILLKNKFQESGVQF